MDSLYYTVGLDEDNKYYLFWFFDLLISGILLQSAAEI